MYEWKEGRKVLEVDWTAGKKNGSWESRVKAACAYDICCIRVVLGCKMGFGKF